MWTTVQFAPPSVEISATAVTLSSRWARLWNVRDDRAVGTTGAAIVSVWTPVLPARRGWPVLSRNDDVPDATLTVETTS